MRFFQYLMLTAFYFPALVEGSLSYDDDRLAVHFLKDYRAHKEELRLKTEEYEAALAADVAALPAQYRALYRAMRSFKEETQAEYEYLRRQMGVSYVTEYGRVVQSWAKEEEVRLFTEFKDFFQSRFPSADFERAEPYSGSSEWFDMSAADTLEGGVRRVITVQRHLRGDQGQMFSFRETWDGELGVSIHHGVYDWKVEGGKGHVFTSKERRNEKYDSQKKLDKLEEDGFYMNWVKRGLEKEQAEAQQVLGPALDADFASLPSRYRDLSESLVQRFEGWMQGAFPVETPASFLVEFLREYYPDHGYVVSKGGDLIATTGSSAEIHPRTGQVVSQKVELRAGLWEMIFEERLGDETRVKLVYDRDGLRGIAGDLEIDGGDYWYRSLAIWERLATISDELDHVHAILAGFEE